jgi:hypothetical protein
MRRLVLIAFLFLTLASCFYRPAYVGEQRRGSVMPCREVSRSHCDVDQCRGAHMDYVTYQCKGTQPVARCVANFRCTSE